MSVARIQQAFEAVLKNAVKDQVENTSITTELMVHPGYKGVSRCEGCGEGPDEFALSTDREHELRVLTDLTLRNYFTKKEVRILSFADIANI